MGGFEPWRHHKASAVSFTDRFLYEGQPPDKTGLLTTQGGPTDGTPFVYGSAGPPRGTVVYDYANKIAFYSQGCCSWHTTVLAAGAKAPPIQVVRRTFNDLRTARGVALGDSSKRVEALYGEAVPQAITGQVGMVSLSYTHELNKYCLQFQNFAFQHDHLVYIELLNAC